VPRRLIAVLLPALLAACASGPQVDFDPQADFSRLTTYSWAPPPQGGADARGVSALMDERIRASVDEQLQARGLRLLPENADLRVSYVFLTQPSRVTRSPSASVGVGTSSRGSGVGVGIGIGIPIGGGREREEGTLILDLVDAQTDRLVWRGSLDRRIAPSDDPEQTRRRVAEAVAELLSEFPPD
jgi:hypothetical protein